MSDIQSFAFRLPLYSKLELPEDNILKAQLLNRFRVNVDGHCPYCQKSSTFTNKPVAPLNAFAIRNDEHIKDKVGYESVTLYCARTMGHALRFWFRIQEKEVMKVGQFPSLADIANDEAIHYRNMLNKTDSAELHKAIGLAAHGVGVGSFVYLRRVFENLIYNRFDELRDAQGWDAEEFGKLRMDEKIEHLKGHIPDFLFENRKLYSILSKGIHQLSEEECLRYFEPMKLSIKIILEEDKRKKEELTLRETAAAAIKDIQLK